jgi:hypothetical protein
MLGCEPYNLEVWRGKSTRCEVDVYARGFVVEVTVGRSSSRKEKLAQVKRAADILRSLGYTINGMIVVKFCSVLDVEAKLVDGVQVILAPRDLLQ